MEQQDPESSLFQLNIDATNNSVLKSAASWAKVLAVLGFIFGILFMVIGVMVQSAIRSVSGRYEGFGYRGSASMIANAGMAVYLFLGIVTIVGSVFALNFGNKILAALRVNDVNALRGGFSGVRNFFAYWAILMIICLLLMIISLASGSLGRI